MKIQIVTLLRVWISFKLQFLIRRWIKLETFKESTNNCIDSDQLLYFARCGLYMHECVHYLYNFLRTTSNECVRYEVMQYCVTAPLANCISWHAALTCGESFHSLTCIHSQPPSHLPCPVTVVFMSASGSFFYLKGLKYIHATFSSWNFFAMNLCKRFSVKGLIHLAKLAVAMLYTALGVSHMREETVSVTICAEYSTLACEMTL